MKNITRGLNLIIGAAVIFGILYCTFNFASAETRIRPVCNQIKLGMLMPELGLIASTHGLNAPRNPNGINFMVENKTYGRYGCKVLLEAGAVKSSEYNFSD